MNLTRRTLFGGALASAASIGMAGAFASAQDEATPGATAGAGPGSGIARVRQHDSPESAQAVYPDVMFRFLPPTAALEGYRGYLFAFDNADPSTTLNVSLLADEATAEAANAVAQDYVAGMDPRLTPETPLADQGPVRVYNLTDRDRLDLSPYLHGCQFTMRSRVTADGVDNEELVRVINEGLSPILAAMDGFVLYAWILTGTGRLSMNIWETREQLQAGDEAVAAFVAENTANTTVGEAIVHSGTVAYSDILGTN